MQSDNLSPTPMPLTLLICDAAHCDPSTGKWSLLGLFNSIHAVDYPTMHPQMVAYLALTEANGMVPLRFQIIEEREIAAPLIVIDAEMTADDPRQVAEIVIPLCDVVFPSAGDYRLQVFACRQFLMERRITVFSAASNGVS
jgi:hypothetical protein